MRASDQPGSRRVSSDCGHSLEGLGHTLAIALWKDVRSRCPACWELKAPVSGVISPDHRRSITMKILLLSLLAAMLAGIEPGAAQVWPLKPVRIVVPFAPGATPDIVARLLAGRLQAKLNQSFV